jgi:cell division protein FtsB
MNRDLQKLLQEKWFLVAADFIAVLGVLCLGLDPKDGFQAFLAVLGILGASLIVVIPVLRDGGGKAERLAEQARLRAALAAEIDRLRDDARAAAEASNRRIGEVELDIRRQAEAAAAAVAQRASTEINALKAEVAALKATAAELEKKVAVAQRSAAVGTEAKESLDDLGAKLESLAETVRSGLATTEETAEVLAELKAAAPAVTAEDLKAVRDEVKKAAQKAAQSADKLDARLDAVSAELQALRDRPVGAPAAPITEDGDEDQTEPVAAEDQEDEEAETDEEAIESEPATEEAAPAAPAAAPVVTGEGTALVINLMIGIGNKPFVRGSGPGLSADHGVPMNFLGIGRWQWVCPQPDAPATVEVWKNDQSPLGEPIHLSGGEAVELDESHFSGA